MDFGVVGLDGLVSSTTNSSSTSSGGGGGGCVGLSIAAPLTSSSDPDLTKQEKHKWLYGSGCLKQGRSSTPSPENGGGCGGSDEWRSSKVSKTENDTMGTCLLSKCCSNISNNNNTSCNVLFCNGVQVQQEQQQHQQELVLSFSCPKQETPTASHRTSTTLPCFPLTSSSAYNRNTGHNINGSFNGVNMQMEIADASIRGGPFTQSQWMELEHQALIYKYLVANVAVPLSLLIPIKKALQSARFPCFPPGLLRPNTLGWGGFHLGFAGNTDPEPGRCRRTDGKKWRCSRDAVPDQKYCERHMNRGRHRSRKPVEGQSGHSAATTMPPTITKPLLNASSSASASASVVGPYGSGASNSSSLMQQNQQQSNISASAPLKGMFLSKENVTERTLEPSKQHGSYADSSKSEFGPEFLLNNPSQKTSTFVSNQQTMATQHSLLQFMDDWPRSQSDHGCSGVSWPQLDIGIQSDRTQLSISIPTDFMSSTSSPNNEKASGKLSRELDPFQMGLGVGTILNEQNQRLSNWNPISWETSMGGPLGEVLHSTSSNNSSLECKNSSALNLMSGRDAWENSSSRIGSSPTGVLQRTTFGSHSNSSAGSSPRAADHYMSNNDHIGSTLVHSSSLPAL